MFYNGEVGPMKTVLFSSAFAKKGSRIMKKILTVMLRWRSRSPCRLRAMIEEAPVDSDDGDETRPYRAGRQRPRTVAPGARLSGRRERRRRAGVEDRVLVEPNAKRRDARTEFRTPTAEWTLLPVAWTLELEERDAEDDAEDYAATRRATSPCSKSSGCAAELPEGAPPV